MEKYQCFATNIFWSQKCDFFWWFWPKNWNCWSDNLQTFHKEKSGVVEKKPRKRKFYPDSSSLWKLIFKKKTNICHYFPSMDLPPNIWSIQLVPFYNPCIWSLFNPLFPQDNIVIINSKWLVLLLYTVKSYQILNKKWNWKYLVPKYFLSETIHTQEKWDQRCSFCKILKFQFPQGLNL